MYRWIDHTAEVELAITAATERDVFADALAALGELLGFNESSDGVHAEREVIATASDRPAMLAAWLEELVFLAESDGFVAMALDRLELAPDRLSATVGGVLDEPRPLVKAVTYHRLSFDRCADGYRASVILDV